MGVLFIEIKKYSVLILLGILFIFAIASASAADLNESDVDYTVKTSEDNFLNDETKELVSVDCENEVSSGSDVYDNLSATYYPTSVSELKSYISSANAGDTIVLSGTYKIHDYTINKKLNFIGTNGATLDGEDNKVFSIKDSVVTFKNISFKNGYGNYGGTMDVRSGQLIIDQCNFLKSYSAKEGGTLYIGETASCYISNSYFTNSKSSMGAVIYANRPLEIINCTFEGNIATDGGGVIRYNSGSSLTIKNSRFNNNHANDYGGVIDARGSNFNIINCNFTNCYCNNNEGGALSFDRVTKAYIDGCYFDSCHSKLDGGAIRIEASSDVTIINSTISNCKSDNHGGAIYIGLKDDIITSDVTIEGSKFINNNAKYDGGAISRHECKLLNIKNSYFEGNSAQWGGAILNYQYNEGLIYNSTFKKNIATQDSGAVSGGSASHCVFIENSAVTYGGATSWLNSVDCTYENNHAEGNGGAMYSGTSSNSKFINNSAEGNGGAMYIESSGEIINSYFEGDNANYGGAIYINPNANCVVINSTFNGCYSRGCGGALHANSVILTIESCNFESNFAKKSGGAIDSYKTGLNIYNCNFTDCYATENDGGAVSSDNNPNVNIIGCNFDSCKAKGFAGSVRIIESTGTVNISKSNFSNSYCEMEGGSVHCKNTNNLFIDNCDFLNSSSKLTGGAVVIWDATNADLSNLLFKDCDSKNYAGSIYIYNVAKFNLRDSDFINSHTAMTGGAIHVNPAGDLNITGCKFDNCSAERYGNAMDLANTEDILIDKCNFTNVNYNNHEAIAFSGSEKYEVWDSFFDKIPSGINIHYNPILEFENLSILQGETGVLTVKLSNTQNVLSYKPVKLNINGKSDTRSTDKNGVVQFTVNNFIYLVGEYDGTISFDGDNVNLPVSNNVKVNVNSYNGNLSVTQIGKYYEDTSLIFKLVNLNTGESIPYANIKVTFSNGQFADLQTDKNGVTKEYKVDFTPDNYTYTARVVDSNVNVNTIENSLEIHSIDGEIEITQYGRIFKFKLYNPDNGDTFRNIKVNLQFSGVDSESVKTNDEGIANYNFPDDKGTYELLVTVNGNQYVQFKPAELKNILINTEYDPSLNDAVYSKIIFGDSIVFDYLKSGSTNMVLVGGSIGSVSVIGHPEAKWSYNNNILTVSNLAVGTYTLRVVTSPFDNYYSTEKTINIVVNKVTAVVIASKMTTILKKGNLWSIKIVDSKTNKPISNLKLTLKVYTGKKYKTVEVKTNSKGEATYQTKGLSKGNHKIVVSSSEAGYKLNTFTSSIKVIKQTALKFKLREKHDDNGGSLRSFVVINKKTKNGVNGIKIKVLIYTGKKYKTFILKTKKIKTKKATYHGAVGFSTNQFSAGKHKVVLKPVSIKYKGSIKTSINLKKKATHGPKYFRIV